MKRREIRRLVCITGLGAGDSRGHGSWLHDTVILPLLLRNVYADKDRQEDAIRASDLDWTIVRPTALKNGPATKAVRALTDLGGVHGGSIARADVAQFVIAQVSSETWLRKAPLVTS